MTTTYIGSALFAFACLWWAYDLRRQEVRDARIDACARALHFHHTTTAWQSCPCPCHQDLGEF